MAELLPRHKERLSISRYELDVRDFRNDIVPSMEHAAVQAFVAELSSLPPVSVPLHDDDDGLYGWPADGVREKIGTHGGSIRFGWRLREWPGVLLTAEFHAVWVDPDGALVDITPAVTDDEPSLFVPDPTYPETFDATQPPPTRYKVLYTGTDRSGEVASRIARMKPTQRAYEERRATKAGKTLEQWIRGKFPTDPLLLPIAAFVDACRSFETDLTRLPDLIETDPRAIGDAIAEHAGPGDAAAAATEAEADAPPDNAVARDPEVSGEPAGADNAAPGETPDAAADGPPEVTGDAPGDAETSDGPEDEFEDPWLPEYETEFAEEKQGDWAAARLNRRLDILRIMPSE